MSNILLHSVVLVYSPGAWVVGPLSVSFNEGEVISLFGPNGCGKSSLLKYLAGYSEPRSQLRLERGSVDGLNCRVGYVPQDVELSIMPWLSLVDNIALPHRLAGDSRGAARGRAMSAVDQLGLDLPLAHVKLSGGQSQAAVLAREISREPDLLLIDEGFGSLDYENRFRAMAGVRAWARQWRRTVLVVSHDAEEAGFVSDRVLILTGSPARIWREVAVERPGTGDCGLDDLGEEWLVHITGYLQREYRDSVKGRSQVA